MEDIYISSSYSSTESTTRYTVHKLEWEEFRRAKGHVFLTYQPTSNQHSLFRYMEVFLSFDVLKSALSIFIENTPSLHAKLQTCLGNNWFGLSDQATAELTMVHAGLKFIILRVHIGSLIKQHLKGSKTL